MMDHPTARRASHHGPVVCGLLLAVGLLLAGGPALGQPQPAQPAQPAENVPRDNTPAANEHATPGSNANGAANATNAPAVVTPLDRRLKEVVALFRADPSGYESIFAPAFLSAVPPAQLTEIFTRYRNDAGAVTEVRIVKRMSANMAEVEVRTEQRKRFPLRIGVDPASPFRVNYLWLGSPTAQFASLDEALAGLKELPGKVTFAAWKLGATPADAVQLGALNPDLALPLGSAFKLFILGALIDEVNAGRRAASNTFQLRDEWKSWPSGVMQAWPDGADVTLHTLATQMISVSDNTATDHLLFILGRERVEAQQAVMGHKSPERNRPFLATHEMFRLKERGQPQRITEYLALDEAGRRDYVRKLVAATPDRNAFGGIDEAHPTAVESIEWFGSGADMCRAMDWLRRNTAPGKPAAALREILAVNPGIRELQSQYRWVGFKGGSEPGVLNLTFLLQRQDDQWVAASVGWTNPDAPVDTARLVAVLQGALGVISR